HRAHADRGRGAGGLCRAPRLGGAGGVARTCAPCGASPARHGDRGRAPGGGGLADRYAVFFTPLTLAVCALAHLLTRQPEAVVAVLVVATTCPLILATPVALISGINRAAASSSRAVRRRGRNS